MTMPATENGALYTVDLDGGVVSLFSDDTTPSEPNSRFFLAGHVVDQYRHIAFDLVLGNGIVIVRKIIKLEEVFYNV